MSLVHSVSYSHALRPGHGHGGMRRGPEGPRIQLPSAGWSPLSPYNGIMPECEQFPGHVNKPYQPFSCSCLTSPAVGGEKGGGSGVSEGEESPQGKRSKRGISRPKQRLCLGPLLCICAVTGSRGHHSCCIAEPQKTFRCHSRSSTPCFFAAQSDDSPGSHQCGLIQGGRARQQRPALRAAACLRPG